MTANASILAAWTSVGALPPIKSNAYGHSPDKSPYIVDLLTVFERFVTSPERKKILDDFLRFCADLYKAGITSGFQWLDGSFCEQIEVIENRPPNDMDVVTFFNLPSGQTQRSISEQNPLLFNRSHIKTEYWMDAYFIQLGQPTDQFQIKQIAYWYSMWSHRRNNYWKGVVQVDLDPSQKARALAILNNSGGSRHGYEYMFIASEITMLEDLLESMPEDNVIERMGFESRLKSARNALAELSPAITQTTTLTFRGKPVFGSHGIAADFAGKAAGAFSEAFVSVVAGMSEALNEKGPTPDRDKKQLLITGTAIGSFGFEFALQEAELSLFSDIPPSQTVMAKIANLFQLISDGSDDELSELIEEVHPRAVKKVYEFLDFLVQQEAWCGIEFADHSFRYASLEQLKDSSVRLKEDNIQELQETWRGVFQGVLPTARTFEFQSSDQESIIKGKIDPVITDPKILNEAWLNKPVIMKFHVMQIGLGRSRYKLKSLSDISNQEYGI